MREIALSRKGKCLSLECFNWEKKLLWECEKGHQWEAIPSSVKKGCWCPVCGGRQRLTIDEMQKIAAERNGKCLSENYVNAQSVLLWECQKGHQWEATPNSIKNGTWCPICAREKLGAYKKLNITILQQFAIERGGKCISTEYHGSKEKYVWECEKGHRWMATADNVMSSSTWCLNVVEQRK